jgi:hypothetical protein
MSQTIILYHSSPNPTIKYLKKNSYATIFPHIANIMGLYYSTSHPKFNQLFHNKMEKYDDVLRIYPYGRPWKDHDLKKQYDFGPRIEFKKGHKPDKTGTMYKVKVNISDVKLLPTFPFELIIKTSPKTKKINFTQQMNIHSVKLFDSCIKNYIYLQSQ